MATPLAPYTCIHLIPRPSAAPALTFPRNPCATHSTVAVIHYPLSKSIQFIGVARSNLHGICIYLAAQIYMAFAFTRRLKFTWHLPLPGCSNLHGICLYPAAQIYMAFAFTRLLKLTWHLHLPGCSNLHGICLYPAAQIYMAFAFTRLLKFTWHFAFTRLLKFTWLSPLPRAAQIYMAFAFTRLLALLFIYFLPDVLFFFIYLLVMHR